MFLYFCIGTTSVGCRSGSGYVEGYWGFSYLKIKSFKMLFGTSIGIVILCFIVLSLLVLFIFVFVYFPIRFLFLVKTPRCIGFDFPFLDSLDYKNNMFQISSHNISSTQ